MTVVDTEPIEALDFDLEAPCESPSTIAHGCAGTNPAEWLLVWINHCNQRLVRFICEPCRRQRIQHQDWRCSACGTRWRGKSNIILIERIKK